MGETPDENTMTEEKLAEFAGGPDVADTPGVLSIVLVNGETARFGSSRAEAHLVRLWWFRWRKGVNLSCVSHGDEPGSGVFRDIDLSGIVAMNWVPNAPKEEGNEG